MKLIEWLESFEAELKSLNQIYNSQKGGKDEIATKEPNGFSNYYFESCLQAYLNIISKVKTYTNNQKQVLSLLTKNLNKETIFSEIASDLDKIDSLRFVPHIFHPYFHLERRQYFFKADRWCYLLATKVREAIYTLPKVEGTFLQLVKNAKGHKLAKILHTLENRISRYEYNLKHNPEIIAYEQEILPKLTKIENNLLDTDTKIEEKAIENIINELNEIIDQVINSQWPASVPQFLRDDPITMLEQATKKRNDSYPTLVTQFINQQNPDEFSDPRFAVQKYQSEFDARNVYLASGVYITLNNIIQILQSNYSELVNDNPGSDFNLLKEKADKLNKFCDSEEKKLNTAEIQINWAHEIHIQTLNLVNAFSIYSSFNPNAGNYLKTKKEINLCRIGKEIYDNLVPLSQMTYSYNNIVGWARKTVFSDLVEHLFQFAQDNLTIYNDLQSMNRTEAKALETFISNIKSCLSLETFGSKKSNETEKKALVMEK